MKMYKINKVLPDNYKNHQMIKEAFPGYGKALWKRKTNYLLVLTNCNLNPSLINNETIIDQGSLEENLSRNLTKKIPFSIRLNACKSRNRKRFSIPACEVNDWVHWKLKGLGFEIESANINSEGCLVSIRQGQKNIHNSVYVEGVLQVQDENVFVQTLTSGIGHAKAYGFGLLDVFHF